MVIVRGGSALVVLLQAGHVCLHCAGKALQLGPHLGGLTAHVARTSPQQPAPVSDAAFAIAHVTQDFCAKDGTGRRARLSSGMRSHSKCFLDFSQCTQIVSEQPVAMHALAERSAPRRFHPLSAAHL